MEITSPRSDVLLPVQSNPDTSPTCDSGNGETGEILHELGAYPPILAKRVLAELEAAKIPFEIEADHSALSDPLRGIQIYLFTSPEGS
ncbi:MAG: hypothetical protein LBV54_06745, partial [Puniceicoccales bacterium]|nr:hypothetical protein [Puniceicoccales bacterium]